MLRDITNRKKTSLFHDGVDVSQYDIKITLNKISKKSLLELTYHFK